MRNVFKILLYSIGLFLCVFTFAPPVSAQATGCIITKVGNPVSPAITLPPECNTGTGKWPFKEKDPRQFRRTDAGWDLQENHIEDPSTGKTWIYAVASGTVHRQCCTGGGYGPHYPYQDLDTPIYFRGRHTSIFYGHVIMIPELQGKHINAGDKIAWTGPRGCTLPGESWCGNGGSYWLEMGWGNSSPEGRSSTERCVGRDIDPYLNPGDPCAWTPAGQAMKDWLSGKPE